MYSKGLRMIGTDTDRAREFYIFTLDWEKRECCFTLGSMQGRGKKSNLRVNERKE